MNLSRLFAALNTLIFRGLGSGVAVLFVVMISRHLSTESAAHFFLLFNICTIASICFRWGLDEVIIRRIAKLRRKEALETARMLMGLAHRRVILWLTSCIILFLLLKHLTPYDLPESIPFSSIFISFCAATLIALSACAARILQGYGSTNKATVILNIAIPGLALLGMLFLINIKKPDAQDIINLYAIVSATVYLLAVSTLYGNPLSIIIFGLTLNRTNPETKAANKLGIVVLAQQLVGWVALLVIPSAYGDDAYKGFVVLQKVATLISLTMLAINFTFSRLFATLYAGSALEELRRMVFYSLIAITLASITIAFFVTFFSQNLLLEYANINADFSRLLVILLVSQFFFSTSALFSLVLSMASDDNYLLMTQAGINGLGAISLVVTSQLLPLETTVYILVFSYFLISAALGVRVLHITRHKKE